MSDLRKGKSVGGVSVTEEQVTLLNNEVARLLDLFDELMNKLTPIRQGELGEGLVEGPLGSVGMSTNTPNDVELSVLPTRIRDQRKKVGQVNTRMANLIDSLEI